jgi:hypothetical protein
VPPKPLTSWTTIVMMWPVESANCTTATESIILRIAIGDLNREKEPGPTHKFHAFNPFMYRTCAHKMKMHILVRCSHTRQQGERSGSEEGGVLYSCTEFVNTRVGGEGPLTNIPYNGPAVQKETTAAVSHVKSLLNAGGGSDIVTSLKGGSPRSRGPVL